MEIFVGVVLAFLAIYIPYRLIKWMVLWISVRMFPFSEKRMKELEYAIQGIGYHVYQKCIIPFGKDIRGKKFKSIDWNALKEKHRYPGYNDNANFFNEIFFGEVDTVLSDIENQLDYINDAWVDVDYSKGGKCVANYVRDYIKSDKFPQTYENYVWLNELGRACADAWNEQVKEQKIQSALDGEYEEEEEEVELEDEDSFYSDDSDTYVAPAPVSSGSRSEKNKRVKYTVYKRVPSGYEYTYSSGLDSAQTAIWMAKNQVSSGANKGCYFRVTDSNGVTVWSAQA